MSNVDPSIDTVEVRLNGRLLPGASGRGSDLHFRLLENVVVGPYGFAVEFELTGENYPKRGQNEVTVTLAKRDARLKSPRQLSDVALSIDYLPHRDFRRDPIPF